MRLIREKRIRKRGDLIVGPCLYCVDGQRVLVGKGIVLMAQCSGDPLWGFFGGRWHGLGGKGGTWG